MQHHLTLYRSGNSKFRTNHVARSHRHAAGRGGNVKLLVLTEANLGAFDRAASQTVMDARGQACGEHRATCAHRAHLIRPRSSSVSVVVSFANVFYRSQAFDHDGVRRAGQP